MRNKKHKLIGLLGFVVIILFLAPLSWAKHVSFDIAKFTEQWYVILSTSICTGIIVALILDQIRKESQEYKIDSILKDISKISQEIVNSIDYNPELTLKKVSELTKLIKDNPIEIDMIRLKLPKFQSLVEELSYYQRFINEQPARCVITIEHIKEICAIL